MLVGSKNKKKKVLIGVGESQPQVASPKITGVSWEEILDTGAFESMNLELEKSSLPKVNWWECRGQERGVVTLPSGQRIFYCENHNDMREIKGMKYDDICTVAFTDKTVGDLRMTYTWNYQQWQHQCATSGDDRKYNELSQRVELALGNDAAIKVCGGPDGCPHVEYMVDAEGNSYVDSCPTCDKDNCLIVNRLNDDIDEKDEEIGKLEDTISDLESDLESKNDEISELEDKIDGLEGDINELSDKIEGLEGVIEEKDEEIAELEERIRDLNEELTEDCPDCSHYEGEFDRAVDHIRYLESKLDRAGITFEEFCD